MHRAYEAYIGTYYREDLLNLRIRGPFNLFRSNMLYQDALYGKHDPEHIQVVVTDGSLWPIDSIPTDQFFGLPIPDQFKMIPFFYDPDYRPGYRIRRTYFTGISRRRRNL